MHGIYCALNSMDSLHIELTETITNICCIIFSLFFPLGFKGVLTTYQIPFSSYFSHRVLGENLSTSNIICHTFSFPHRGFWWKYTRHIYCSLNLHMSFSFLRFSHMSYQRDNNNYMLHHFLLIFPLGLKEF